MEIKLRIKNLVVNLAAVETKSFNKTEINRIYNN